MVLLFLFIGLLFTLVLGICLYKTIKKVVNMDKKELTIIQMNDTHGYIDEHFEYIWQGSREKFVKVGG